MGATVPLNRAARLQNQQAAQELGKQSPLCMSLVDSLGGHG